MDNNIKDQNLKEKDPSAMLAAAKLEKNNSQNKKPAQKKSANKPSSLDRILEMSQILLASVCVSMITITHSVIVLEGTQDKINAAHNTALELAQEIGELKQAYFLATGKHFVSSAPSERTTIVVENNPIESLQVQRINHVSEQANVVNVRKLLSNTTITESEAKAILSSLPLEAVVQVNATPKMDQKPSTVAELLQESKQAREEKLAINQGTK